MQNNQIKQLNIDEKHIFVKPRGILGRVLPVLLFVSFLWLNFYDTLAEVNNFSTNFSGMEGAGASICFYVFIQGLIDYIVFEFLFFIYRFCLGFSIYSFMIPKYVLIDKFRGWYIVRNLVLGLFFNLRFFFPYIGTYLCVIELICNFVLIICLYYDLQKEYVEPLVGQFVFKTLALPVVLYEIYYVIKLMAGVL